MATLPPNTPQPDAVGPEHEPASPHGQTEPAATEAHEDAGSQFALPLIDTSTLERITSAMDITKQVDSYLPALQRATELHRATEGAAAQWMRQSNPLLDEMNRFAAMRQTENYFLSTRSWITEDITNRTILASPVALGTSAWDTINFAAHTTGQMESFFATQNSFATSFADRFMIPPVEPYVLDLFKGFADNSGWWQNQFATLDRVGDHFAALGRIGKSVSDLALILPAFTAANAISSSWVFEQMLQVSRLIHRLPAPILWQARIALDAYIEDGDSGPMLEFIAQHLRLRPPTEDHVQALALALLEGEWRQEVDLQDPVSVRKALRARAKLGDYEESRHQVKGYSIGYLDEADAWQDCRSREPGPDVLAIEAALNWGEQIGNRHVRLATGRLKDQERRVARAWAENPPINWGDASELIHLEEQVGDRTRRKLRRIGNEITARFQKPAGGEAA